MTENNNALETHKKPETPARHKVVGIRFRPCGRIYTFEADDNLNVALGTQVVVESEMGLSIGFVVARPKHTIEKTSEPLKRVLRIASEKDIETVKNNRSLENEAKAFCIEKAKEYDLEMKIVATETTLDKKRLIFYFTADGRIDFRELVRDLAAKFKTRIEMRQIGVRDEVKLLGGIGACGRQTCCSLFLTSFEPITIRMAKQQELSINQSKLSGICGRLMCCLSYEYQDTGEEAGTPAEKVEAPVIVVEEPSESSFLSADSIGTQIDTLQQEAVISSCKCDINLKKEEKAVSSETEKTKEERKAWRRRRKRMRKSRLGRVFRESATQDKSGVISRTHEGEQQQTVRNEKGKPFSKRRKFWRKKKH